MLQLLKLLLITFIILFSTVKCNLLNAKQILQMSSTHPSKVETFYKVSAKETSLKINSVQPPTLILKNHNKKDTDSLKNNPARQIEKTAKAKLGKQYKWGGNGPLTYDCSGFTKKVFEQNGINLPRVSIKQAEIGKKIKHANNLKKGDLVFFRSKHHHKVDHVGIYLGNGKFIHASQFHQRIVISPFREYKRFFKWGRRLT